jgi:hypothetical protein
MQWKRISFPYRLYCLYRGKKPFPGARSEGDIRKGGCGSEIQGWEWDEDYRRNLMAFGYAVLDPPIELPSEAFENPFGLDHLATAQKETSKQRDRGGSVSTRLSLFSWRSLFLSDPSHTHTHTPGPRVLSAWCGFCSLISHFRARKLSSP